MDHLYFRHYQKSANKPPGSWTGFKIEKAQARVRAQKPYNGIEVRRGVILSFPRRGIPYVGKARNCTGKRSCLALLRPSPSLNACHAHSLWCTAISPVEQRDPIHFVRPCLQQVSINTIPIVYGSWEASLGIIRWACLWRSSNILANLDFQMTYCTFYRIVVLRFILPSAQLSQSENPCNLLGHGAS
jgi:hypothetical protein